MLSKISIWGLELAYNDAANQITQIGILQYMWNRIDIPKVEKLDLLLKVARHGRSIKNVAYALRTFEAATSAKVPVFDVDYAENWWQGHRQEFVNK